MQKKRCTALLRWIGDASVFMAPVKVFPSVAKNPFALDLDGAGHVAYKGLPPLQMISPVRLGSERALAGGDRCFREWPGTIDVTSVALLCEGSRRARRGKHTRAHGLRGPAQFLSAVAITSSILLTITVSAAPERTGNAVTEIRSVLQAQQDAWNRGDIDGFMNGYARSASTVFISEDTVRRG